MSAPLVVGAIGATLLLGMPVIAASVSLEVRHRAAGAADAAALGAADALHGWIDAEPCSLADRIAERHGVELVECRVGEYDVRVIVRAAAPLGMSEQRARAGTAFGTGR